MFKKKKIYEIIWKFVDKNVIYYKILEYDIVFVVGLYDKYK